MSWPLDENELDELTRQVDELAWDLARRLLSLPAGTRFGDMPPGARRTVALAKLAAYEHLRKQTATLAAEAAGAAADAGADYVEIAEAVGLTKQGARQRWPNLTPRTKAARTGDLSAGQQPLPRERPATPVAAGENSAPPDRRQDESARDEPRPAAHG